MANVRDEHGNPVQLTDERGNPVELTDEFGNRMHLTGVVGTTPSKLDPTPISKHDVPTPVTTIGEDIARTQISREAHDGSPRCSSSSSSSSSEDDGQGGRRRKKKGLTQKIKEKLIGSGKHKEGDTAGAEQQHHHSTTVTSTTVEHQEHGKKGVMEKIKEKLPGHHH